MIVSPSFKNMPYIYQREYYSIAWVKEHYGYFIDPKGNKYVYKSPTDWINPTVQPYEEHPPQKAMHGYEINAELKSEDLLSNLKKAKKALNLSAVFGENVLKPEILQALLKSKVTGKLSGMTDQGTELKAIWIYIPEREVYKRIILSTDGHWILKNTSIYANQI